MWGRGVFHGFGFGSLLTAHCSLLTAHCSLLTAHCSLLTWFMSSVAKLCMASTFDRSAAMALR